MEIHFARIQTASVNEMARKPGGNDRFRVIPRDALEHFLNPNGIHESCRAVFLQNLCRQFRIFTER